MLVFPDVDIILSLLDISSLLNPFVLCSSVLVVFITYYVRNVATKPALVCQNGRFKSFLLENCPVLLEKYSPTFWCFHSHAQTALANVFRCMVPDFRYEREIIKLKDGGIVGLDWLEGSTLTAVSPQPIVLFLTGITGHSQATYIKSLVLITHKLGCRSAVLNYRGRGGVDILTPKTYCACDTKDLREVLNSISHHYPNVPVYAVGVSLGGIILGHYLTESGEESEISAALFISAVYDPHASVVSLNIPGINRMLNKYVAQQLCGIVRPYKEVFNEINIDIDHVLKSETIEDFDERFTARVFNFRDADDYYTAVALKSKMADIRIPLLCVNAADDMFSPGNAIPCEEILKTKNVAVLIPSRGGHIGFMDGIFPVTPFFSERVFEQYLKALLSQNVNKNNKSAFT